jgi:phosphopantothenate-cysteine ligase
MKRQNIVITAGGTSERIDNVRKITNSSSGKLGLAIANELLKAKYDEIGKIYYICSKSSVRPDNSKVEIIEIDGTIDLKNTVEFLLTTKYIDYFIHSMAVSDYMVNYVTNTDLLAQTISECDGEDIADAVRNNTRILTDSKISSTYNNLVIVLKQTPKVISLVKTLSPYTYLVGFKLLDGVSKQKLVSVAIKLRDKNKCDLVVANDLSNIRSGYHKAVIIDKNDNLTDVNGKEDIASKLVRKMYND